MTTKPDPAPHVKRPVACECGVGYCLHCSPAGCPECESVHLKQMDPAALPSFIKPMTVTPFPYSRVVGPGTMTPEELKRIVGDPKAPSKPALPKLVDADEGKSFEELNEGWTPTGGGSPKEPTYKAPKQPKGV